MQDKKELGKKAQELQNEIDFETKDYHVVLDTSMGPIRLDLYPDIAPKHCKNIIGLAKSGFYDELDFHRVVKGFVIQGGCPQGSGTGGPGYKVEAEFNNKPHVAGTLSMARSQDPNSAGSQFFICLEKAAFLDGQYTVFGQTSDAESLETVKKIGAVSTGAQDRPNSRIQINKASVVEQPK